MPLKLAPNDVELLAVVDKINTVSSSCVITQDVSELEARKEEFIILAANYLRVAGQRDFCVCTLTVAGVFGLIALGYAAYCEIFQDEYQPLIFAVLGLFGTISLLYSISYASSLCEYNSVKSQLYELLVPQLDIEFAAEKNWADVLEDQDTTSGIKSYIQSLDHSSLWTEHNRSLHENELRSMLDMEKISRH